MLTRSNTVNTSALGDIIYTPLLREVSFGLREGLPLKTTAEEAREIKAKELGIPVEEVIDPAETLEEVSARQRDFLTMMWNDLLNSGIFTDNTSSHTSCAASEESDDNIIRILVISHGGYIRRFLRMYCRFDVVEKIDNCAVSIITLSKNNDDALPQCKADFVNLHHSSTYVP